MHRSRDSVT